MASNSWHRVGTQVPAPDWTQFKSGASEAPESAGSQKRSLDVFIAALALMFLWPVLLTIAVVVKLTSRGPVLFRSRRIGKDGRVFECLKFRTMTADACVTQFGALLRRFGMDELPQLINVLKGDMSIVGPRPVMAGDVDQPAVMHMRRFDMNPGMTGLWAVQESHYPVFGGYVSADECYREQWSAWLDVRIMVRSLGAALQGRGC